MVTLPPKAELWIRNLVFPLLIVIAWFLMARYTFNEKMDLNGDNVYYYTVASAMADGQGYSNPTVLGTPPTATYPPGYPLLMTPLRLVTDSIVAQKWQNEIFVLVSLLLLYFMLLRLRLPMTMAFTAAFAGAFIPRLWHFSTMMMSEASFLLTAVIALYCVVRMGEKEDNWWSELRSPWFYLMVIAMLLNYYIRTQGLALVAALCLCFLLRMRWAALGGTIVSFVLGYLPWSIRNKVLGLSNTRYLDMVMVANPWRPEEGALSIPEFIERFFDTFKMLIFQAFPSTILPFASANPDQPEYTIGLYVLGTIMVVLMLLGAWQLGKVRWAVIGYVAATLGIISMFSTPSGNRYLTGILPILTAILLIGIWWLLTKAIQLKWKKLSFPALLLLPLLLFSKPGLAEEHDLSAQRFPVPYQQFFQIGRQLKKIAPKDAVVCSRKPQMLYMYSNRPGTCYKFTPDAKELILDLVEKNVDYVVLDALGYGSTPRYLWPAVQTYPQYFPQVIMHFENTHTYLVRFDREKAEKELKN